MMLIRILSVVIFYACQTASSYSTTFTSVKNGTWADTSTWDKGTTPSYSDTIIIEHFVQALDDITMYAPGYLLIEQNGTLCGRNLNLEIICDALFNNYGNLYVDSLLVNGLANNYGYVEFTAIATIYGPCPSGSSFYSTGTINIIDSITCSLPLGMDNPRNESDYEIKLTPNPAYEDIYVSLNLPSAGEISMLIYDTKGRVVKTLIVSKILNWGIQKIRLNIKDLTSGIYLLHMEVNGSATIKRLVKIN